MGSTRPRIGVVGESSSSNVGDQLIFSIISELLHAEAEVVRIPLTRGESPLQRLRSISSTVLVRQALSAVLELDRLLFRQARERRRLTKVIASCDAVLIGGGELIRKNSNGFLENIDIIRQICHHQKKRYAFFGVGVSDTITASEAAAMQRILKGASYIGVRDEQSRSRLSACSAVQGIHSAPDVVFHSTTGTLSAAAAARRGAGINVMSYAAFAAGLARRGISLERDRYLAFFDDAARACDRQGMEVRIFTTGSSGDLPDAETVRARLARHMNIGPTVLHPATVKEFCSSVGSLKYVLASRMHAGIYAHMAGAKVSALDWDGKVRPCWEMVGGGDMVLPPDLLPRDGAGVLAAQHLIRGDHEQASTEADRAIGDGLRDCLKALAR